MNIQRTYEFSMSSRFCLTKLPLEIVNRMFNKILNKVNNHGEERG